MKVLYWTPLFWPDIGGIERLSMDVLPALKAQGHEIVVLTSLGTRAATEREQFGDIPVYRFPFLATLWTREVREIVKVQRSVAELKRWYQPDLVHLHLASPISYFHLRTLHAHPATTLVTVHGLFGHRGGADTLLGQTLRAADWVTAVSGPVLEYIRHLVPEIGPRSTAIPNGVRRSERIPSTPRFDPPRILCAGRLSSEKGFDVALRAFAMLIEQYPRARLTVAGDGPDRSALEQLAARLGITHATEFRGWVDPADVPQLMENSTILAIPSRQEGAGLVALEAAAVARPVVATCVGGLAESVADMQTGLLVKAEDPVSFARALAFLLSQPKVAVQMGKAGQARVRAAFSLAACVAAYDTLYRRLIGRPRSAAASS